MKEVILAYWLVGQEGLSATYFIGRIEGNISQLQGTIDERLTLAKAHSLKDLIQE